MGVKIFNQKDELLYNKKQVAEMLGVSEGTLPKWLMNGWIEEEKTELPVTLFTEEAIKQCALKKGLADKYLNYQLNKSK